MKLLSLNCNHCGASLDVPENTRFVTCAHCQSKLKIEESGGAYFTSILERIDAKTSDMQQDLKLVRLHEELERLDREHQINLPKKESTDTVVLSVAIVFGGLMIWGLIESITRGGPVGIALAITTIIGAIVGVLLLCLGDGKPTGESYEQRREKLVREIETAKMGKPSQ